MSIISDYEIFARVVNAGNMSAAGRELGLSPAVVSKRISHLEKRLGTRLLQRTTRQLTLTESGNEFFSRVVHILEGIEEAEAIVACNSARPRGTLRVSAPTSFANMHIAPHMPDFLETYPELRIHLEASDDQVDIIGSGLDVSITVGDLKDSTLIARWLAPNIQILCAAPSYLKRHGPINSVEQLADQAALTSFQQNQWALIGPKGRINVKVDPVLESNSSDFLFSSLLAGTGVSLRSLWKVGPEIERGNLVQILPQFQGATATGIHAVFPCREFMPSKLKVFLDFFGERVRQSPYLNKDFVLDDLSPVRKPVIRLNG